MGRRLGLRARVLARPAGAARRAWALTALAVALAGAACDRREAPAPARDERAAVTSSPSSASPTSRPSGATSSSAAPTVSGAPTASASAKSAGARIAGGPFTRGCERETRVDQCACLGATGMACGGAFDEEPDPVVRRFMLRMVEAEARVVLEELKTSGEGLSVPHAEAAMFCKESGPCGGKDADGNELDGGYACLTAASLAYDKKAPPASNAKLARACKCGAREARIPVMGGMGILACSEKGEPMAFGASLELSVAQQVRACAECRVDGGLAACEAEVARLEASDPELAKYLVDKHAAHCRTAPKPQP